MLSCVGTIASSYLKKLVLSSALNAVQCPEKPSQGSAKAQAPLVVIVEEAESINAEALADLIKLLHEVRLWALAALYPRCLLL